MRLRKVLNSLPIGDVQNGFYQNPFFFYALNPKFIHKYEG